MVTNKKLLPDDGNKYIDMHVHSTASDGTLPPQELVRHAYDVGLCAFAVTDHDNVNGYLPALRESEKLKAEGKNIRVIPGVEISTFTDRDIHILGYFIDCTNKAFLKALEKGAESRNERNEKLCDNLRADGVDIHLDDLEFGTPGTIITRAHFARYLIQKGYVSDNKSAFEKYLGTHTKYYVSRTHPTPAEGIRIILEGGGVPVLAHPLMYRYSLTEIDSLASSLKDAGLAGIETVYVNNEGMDEQNIRAIAKKYGLLSTGGSDFHGANKKGIELGVGHGNLRIPYEFLSSVEKYHEKIIR
jgi:predicted metal-dependent phosphoesterase TrpH